MRILIVALLCMFLSGCTHQGNRYDWTEKETDIAILSTTYKVEHIRVLKRIADSLDILVKESTK